MPLLRPRTLGTIYITSDEGISLYNLLRRNALFVFLTAGSPAYVYRSKPPTCPIILEYPFIYYLYSTSRTIPCRATVVNISTSIMTYTTPTSLLEEKRAKKE